MCVTVYVVCMQSDLIQLLYYALHSTNVAVLITLILYSSSRSIYTIFSVFHHTDSQFYILYNKFVYK